MAQKKAPKLPFWKGHLYELFYYFCILILGLHLGLHLGLLLGLLLGLHSVQFWGQLWVTKVS